MRLTIETVRSEFPHFEAVQCFSAFNLRDADVQSLETSPGSARGSRLRAIAATYGDDGEKLVAQFKLFKKIWKCLPSHFRKFRLTSAMLPPSTVAACFEVLGFACGSLFSGRPKGRVEEPFN